MSDRYPMREARRDILKALETAEADLAAAHRQLADSWVEAQRLRDEIATLRDALDEVKKLASDPFTSEAVALRACLLAAYDGLGLPTGIDQDAPERQIARAIIRERRAASPAAEEPQP